jgi:uncharacterized protein (DUF1684 family)
LFTTSILIAQRSNDLAYLKEIEAHRKKKDKEFKKGEKSPVLEKQRRKFKGLHYFAANSNYKVEAAFIRDLLRHLLK